MTESKAVLKEKNKNPKQSLSSFSTPLSVLVADRHLVVRPACADRSRHVDAGVADSGGPLPEIKKILRMCYVDLTDILAATRMELIGSRA